MKCERCKKRKIKQKYTDLCDNCVNLKMKDLWDKKLSPSIKSFLKQLKGS